MELNVAKMIIPAGGIMVLPFLTLITFLFWPGAMLKVYNWFIRRRMGLVVSYSYSGSYRFCYSSRGTPGGATPSLLMLHGFSASKDMWLPFLKFLPKNLHLVCVDMPGHEGTSRTSVEDYSIQGQVARIHQFVQSIGLDKRPFHLVGISMGGNVAGVYAACYPAHLSSVSLMCPAGLDYPTDSEFITHLKELELSQKEEAIALIPTTVQELKNMLRLSCHMPLNLHRQVLQGFLDNRLPNNSFYKEVLREICGETSRYSLQENMHRITAPLQVIWGKEDQLLDVSGAGVLQAAQPSCRVELLDNCGHSVTVERPRKCAKLVMDFLYTHEVNGEDAKKRS
ncbi:monoacylglycerol lipase abhd6-A [Hippoglossus stenolepis]|uniref:monoacylglycerol lipase abhd6-A n=1 Tax=Hippoglossus stenolepis TaxID=195615 RepID=UPI00159BF92E|nr:monoacylglycerol lipase abhd6-A [Hippoglossus stenolepis]XP_035009158.1 monoacylglycerol lipase abhd6-A [Hippoglossus stenolepis]XP_035009159.1 monoacylglycerol lipase abhd6-A [Hippoglossus stenolepis]